MTASYNLCLKRKHQIFTVRIVSSYTSEFLIADFAEQNIRRDLEISVYNTCLFATYYNINIVIIILSLILDPKKVDELS